MSYLDAILAPRERILLRTRRHPIALARSGVSLLVALVLAVAAIAYFHGSTEPWVGRAVAGALLVVALAVALPRFLRWRSEESLVTDRRVLQTRGIFDKHVLDSSLEKVNDVTLSQTVLGRMMGYGTIEILTGNEGGLNRLEKLRDPIGFKRAMMEARESIGSRHQAGGSGPVPTAPRSEAADERSRPPSHRERLRHLEELRKDGLVTEEEYREKRAGILGQL